MIVIDESNYKKIELHFLENYTEYNDFYDWITSLGCKITVHSIPNWNYMKEGWDLSYSLSFTDPNQELLFRLKYL